MTTSAVQDETATKVFATPAWLDEAARVEEKFCREIRRADPREVVSLLAASQDESHLMLRPYLEKRPRAKILEIGAGYGFKLCRLRKLGLDAVGIEPGGSAGYEGRYEMAVELLEANGVRDARSVVLPAFGEALPFADASFDIVYSIAVLEHVRDIEKCLTEAMRVVKPGGVVLMAVPNYNSFYEGHYDILWLPHLLKSKRVAKWYVKTLYGRRDWFIDELHFTTPGYFKRLSGRVAGLGGMQVYLDPDFRIPLAGRLFQRAAEIHDFFRARPADEMRLKHRALMRSAGLVLDAGEMLGMTMSCRLVWERPLAQTATGGGEEA